MEVQMIRSFKKGFTLAEDATHADMFKGSRKSAFTLAEVLITLGIIGVVAAMTMPTLMNSTNGAQYKTAYKKALSVLSQAVVLNVALDDYDLSQTLETGGTDSPSLYTLFKDRMNVVKEDLATAATDTSKGWSATNASDKVKFGPGSGNYTLYFNDGIVFTFKADEGGCTNGNETIGKKHCLGVIDVNGEKNPNKVVTCDGTDSKWNDLDEDCNVSNPTDIYPVVMYDQTVLPKTKAAEAVLYGGK